MSDQQPGRIHVETDYLDSNSGPGAAITRVTIDPDQITITYDVSPAEVVAWLTRHGHRGWYAGHAPGADADTVVMFDRGPDTPVEAAMPGNTLTVQPDGSISNEGETT